MSATDRAPVARHRAARSAPVVVACIVLTIVVGITAAAPRARAATAASTEPATPRPRAVATGDADLNPGVPCPTVFTAADVAAFEARFAGRRFTASVWDERTGCRYELHPGAALSTASVFKLSILARVERRAQDQGRGLTAWEDAQVWPMITESWDAPAGALFEDLGGTDAANAWWAEMGLHDTFTPSGLWGLTTTTAADQVEVVRLLIGDRPGYLDDAHRANASWYLSHVVPEQRWGMGADLPAGWGYLLKNGFYPASCCGWRINSAGRAWGPDGGGYETTVLSDGWASYDEGIDAIETITSLVNSRLAIADPGTSPFGNVETVQPGAAPGTLDVSGWVLDPDTAAPTDVHVYVDQVAVALRADQPRGDVAAAYGWAGAAHGFRATLAGIISGAHTVCVYGINGAGTPGANALLSCRVVTIPSDPVGVLDAVTSPAASTIRVDGWALDPDTSASIRVDVYVDGVGVPLPAAQTRLDVAAVFPAYGAAHGFDATLGGVGGGWHQVCAYGVNAAGSPGQSALLGCRSVLVVSGAPFGNLESVTRGLAAHTVSVRGWTIDPDTPAATAVHVYVDAAGFVLGAGLPRGDVGLAYPAAGAAHGFDATLGGITSGSHTVCAYAINVTGTPGPNALIGCRTVRVA